MAVNKIVVKKVVVGTPIRRVTAGAFSITNLGGVTVGGESDGSIIAYKTSSGDYVTTNLKGQENIRAVYDSGNNQYVFSFRGDSYLGNFIPAADSAQSLGSPDFKWKDLYLSGGTVHLGGLQLKDSGGSFTVIDSATGTTLLTNPKFLNVRGNANILTYDSATSTFTFDDSDMARTNVAETFHQGLTILNGLTIDSGTVTGSLTIGGGATIGGNLNVTGDLVYDDMTADSATFAGTVTVGTNVTSPLGRIAQFTSDSATITTITNTNLIGSQATFDSANIASGTASLDSARITNLTSPNFTGSQATFDSADIGTLRVTGNATVDGNLDITGDLTFDDLSADSATFSGNVAVGESITAGQRITSAQAVIDSASIRNISGTALTYNTVDAIRVTVDSAVIASGTAFLDSARITNLTSPNFTGSQATFDSVNITTLNATNLTFSSASVTDLTADSAKIGGIDLTGNNLTTTGKLFYANVFNNEIDLPSASTYHGMFAHVHATGRGYFAHAGAWHKLIDSDTTGVQQVFTLKSNFADIDSATIDSATITNLTITNTVDSANITNLTNTSLTSDTAAIDSADIRQLSADFINADSAFMDSATITNLAVTQLTISQATFDSARIPTIDNTIFRGSQATIDSANIDSATITNLANTQFTGSQATIDSADITTLNTTTATVTNATVDSATITNLANTQLTGSQATFDSARITNIRFDNVDAQTTSTIRNLFSATQDLTYDSATGQFSIDVESIYTKANFDSDFDDAFKVGTGVSYDSATNQVSIGQAVGTTDNVTFAQTTMDSAIVDGINFNTLTSPHATTVGTLYYESDHQKGLSFNLNTQNNPTSLTTLNIGQDVLVYVHNLTGAQIDRGDAVYISGTAHGKHPQVSLARANASATGQPTGLATQDIPDGAHGWVQRFGIVRGVNTGGITAGATLYLSPDSAGRWREQEVTVDSGYPYHIGRVLTSDSINGAILVDGFSEHYEYLRIEDRLKVSGRLQADSTSLLNIQFDTTTFDSHQPYSEGLLFYDNKHKTLNYFDDITEMNHEIGLQEHQRVFNNTGALIQKGKPLYFSGNYTSGDIDVPTVALADATDVNAYNAQGIAAQDIPNNSYGHCLIAGQLTEVNTSGLSAGDNFFVGLGPGLVQNASPVYPNFPMCLGWVVLSGDSNTGILLVNQQNHSVRSFRVQTSAHIGTDLQVDGNLTILGSQTTVGTSNVTQGAPFYRLNEGDAIGEAGTVFTGSGLDDAFFAGHFTGTSPQSYYVRIDGVGTGPGGVDTFEVALGNDSTFTAPTETKTPITGEDQLIHSADNISVNFGATTGHDSGDRWQGTASPVNVDTGFFSNRNTGTSGVGYTHVGFFFDVSDEKWKLLDEYDSTPTGTITVTDSSLGTMVAARFEGPLTGAVTGNASTATALANGRDFQLSGQITSDAVSFDGTGNVTLVTDIAAGSIKDSDISAIAAIQDGKLATITTAGKVNNSATTATATNTASAIVTRDASGNFAAGTITADINRDAHTTVTAATYGASNTFPVITVDANGFLDSAGSLPVTLSPSYDSTSGILSLTDGTGTIQTNITPRFSIIPDSDISLLSNTIRVQDLHVGNLHVDSADIITIARNSLLVGGDLSYDSGTGQLSFTQRTDAQVRGLVSGDKGLVYNNSTGVFDVDSANIRGFFSASGLSYNSGTGAFSLSATQVMDLIKTVDSNGSGLNAATLDGQEGTYYRIDVFDASGTLLN